MENSSAGAAMGDFLRRNALTIAAGATTIVGGFALFRLYGAAGGGALDEPLKAAREKKKGIEEEECQSPSRRAIVDWLDGLKKGWGQRYAKAFEVLARCPGWS